MTETDFASAFDPLEIAPETQALNDDIVAKMSVMPDPWAFPPAQIRELRKAGRGIFPLPPPSKRAETFEIPGVRGPIGMRVVAPAGGPPRGVYLHIHGGGWTYGSNDMQDDRLEAFADASGFAALSVEYKLAPEWPYPAGPDDCEHAALWLMRNGEGRFGTTRFAIGGESAGAHLSMVTMLRLRDRHGTRPFMAANLIAGCYDLGLLPAARDFHRRLILTTRDIRGFVRNFVPADVVVASPDVSPINADLSGLPPCHLSVGTLDPLVDDSLFMAGRLATHRVPVDLAVWPGGCHVFQAFDLPMAREAEARSAAFVARLA